MQGWILSYDFYQSANCLDDRRLLANIYENIHGLASLVGLNDKLINPKRSVKNHPNIKRWDGYIQAYINYIHRHLMSWDDRYPIKDTSINLNNMIYIMEQINVFPLVIDLIPKWITDELIQEHKQILLQKDYKFYSQVFNNIKHRSKQ